MLLNVSWKINCPLHTDFPFTVVIDKLQSSSICAVVLLVVHDVVRLVGLIVRSDVGRCVCHDGDDDDVSSTGHSVVVVDRVVCLVGGFVGLVGRGVGFGRLLSVYFQNISEC